MRKKANPKFEKFKKIREQDPGFEKALKKLVDAEARHSGDDPAEGKRVAKKRSEPKR